MVILKKIYTCYNQKGSKMDQDVYPPLLDSLLCTGISDWPSQRWRLSRKGEELLIISFCGRGGYPFLGLDGN